ncbi:MULTISPECIES: LCP family protein [Streptomyces]|uniref:LCP family protein n=1 Tax=Streptomyces evansiae TaxID=3075535 RepID=A0ABU2QXK3_9ACTN|nr:MULTISPECIES: LCP family protein [unclassified Streptomyces]MDT0408589.1 LCP family protein [Streptomyces sp. DSM 41979]MYQ57171.1 LytR family transcriptional regulator [Streptomyces sp. SID4926]SCE23461.1 transcriptional attenuator, LytR family [Streptomyces sp. DfronAA-171]
MTRKEATAQGGASSRPGGRRSGARRSRPKGRSRLLKGLGVLAAFAVLACGGFGWVWLKLSGDIGTFDQGGVAKDRPDDAGPGENILVIGSDTRSGKNKELGGGEGDIGRSDTAFLLHVYADHRHAVAVSVPRDTLVEIPRCRLPDGSWSEPQPNTMFNAAFTVGQTEKGNPACTQNTVEKLTGLRVDHTVVVDFNGFSELTSVVGGVPVCLPNDIYQRDLSPKRPTRGDLVFHEGLQKVSGQRALDYVRLRHGVGDGSDIGRIKRQQAFVSALLKKVKEKGLTPTRLLPLAEAATGSMTVDPGLGSADKMLSFALSLKNVDLHNTKFVTIPWRYEGERVAIVQPDADRLWAALKADKPLAGAEKGTSKSADAKNDGKDVDKSAEPVTGAGITVAIRNGTTVPGLAAKAAGILGTGGFTVASTGNAADLTAATTTIAYGPGEKKSATTTARWFPGANLTETGTPGITVTVGRTYADDPAAAPATPQSDSPAKPVGSDARSADENPCEDLSYG